MTFCYLCDGPIVEGDRMTVLLLTDRLGAPAGSFVMHVGCKDELVLRTPALFGVPEVDLDDVG